MTSRYTNIKELINRLIEGSEGYYIEQESISSYEEIDGHGIYSRYKKFDGQISSELLEEHLNKNINLAISLKNKNFVIFEYYGKEAYAFGSLLYKFVSQDCTLEFDILNYNLDNLTIFIGSKERKGNDIKKISENLSKKLQNSLQKQWRVLPLNSRPEIGNLLLLPRELIDNPWR